MICGAADEGSAALFVCAKQVEQPPQKAPRKNNYER